MLIEKMPGYYKKSKVMTSLMSSCDEEINAAIDGQEDFEKQLFIDTATWGLSLWEKELDIETNLSKSYQNRREAIKAKLRGSGTCTIEMIKSTALAYTNAEIEVTEDASNYFFKIKFIGTIGIPPDIEAFKKTIDQIKPAHLAYELEYTYATWGDIRKKKWGEVKKKTWKELRNGG